MAAENQPITSSTPQPSRLLSCFLSASENGPDTNAIMLCEVIGDEIQSISLRVAANLLSLHPADGQA